MNGDCYNGSMHRRIPFRQGDILLVDFGTEAVGNRRGGRMRPAMIVGNSKTMNTGSLLLVVPLYRQPSRDCQSGDFFLKPASCRGLRYAEYMQPLHVMPVRKVQVVRRIGQLTDTDLKKAILDAMQNMLIGE